MSSIDLSGIVRKILEKGFDEVIVSYNKISRTMVKIANSQPSVAQNWSDITIDLYLSKNKKILVTTLNISSEEEIYREIERLSELLTFFEQSFIYAPIPEPDSRARPLSDLVRDQVVRFVEEPREVAEIIINKAHEEGAERIAGTLDGGIRERCIATSRGFEACEKGSLFTVYVRAFRGEGSGQWGYGGRDFTVKDLEEAAVRASYYARESNRTLVDVEPGKYNIILTPLVVGNFLDYITMALNGLNKILGTSFFAKNNPGDQIASERLTLIEDPGRTDMIDSTGFDDEGVATTKKSLIERGVLRTFLHNTKTASVLETKSTGNAGWIYPRPWNLIIETGDYEESEMIKDVKRGLLVNNNWYTRYQNVLEGSFSTVTRDALLVIENGEIRGAARRVRIADRFPNLLRNIRGVGKKSYKVKWWEVRRSVDIPFILIESVNITRPS
ncbi:MAG: TldD/PmbA family protein [Sulfolobales archaeon]